MVLHSKRLDGIYGIHRLSRRQRQVDSLATSMQLRLDKEDEASMKSVGTKLSGAALCLYRHFVLLFPQDTETLCQQVLFLAKEDYANVKLKWRDLDNTKGEFYHRSCARHRLTGPFTDPPPETAQINAFTDATKAIAQARDVLAAYCRRKAIPFEIAG